MNDCKQLQRISDKGLAFKDYRRMYYMGAYMGGLNLVLGGQLGVPLVLGGQPGVMLLALGGQLITGACG